jgi:hypothetical protein
MLETEKAPPCGAFLDDFAKLSLFVNFKKRNFA